MAQGKILHPFFESAYEKPNHIYEIKNIPNNINGRGTSTRKPKEAKPKTTAPAAEPAPAPAAPRGDMASGADVSAAEDEAQTVVIEKSRAPNRRDRKAERERRRQEKKDARRGKARDYDSEAFMPESEEDGEAQVAVDAPVAAWPEDDYHDWGQSIYLSNDDTMSLSSAQRVLFAIDNFLQLPLDHIRPHELLNYFSFETAPVANENDFSVLAGIAEHEKQPGIYGLALAVRGRPVDLRSRRNAQMAIVVDRSGSMAAEGRMEYLKRGLIRMLNQLKNGDIVHLVIFDHQVCTPISNFVVGRDPRRILESAIRKLTPRGSTDLHSGLRTGYQLADAAYQPAYTNRVVMITDALANTGVTDTEMISMISRYYDSRRIRLSGVGVGREFNDALLDRLTERGKGAYVFLGSEAEVDAVFGARFVSLIETTAGDVHFQLHLPPSLRMNVFYGEESSVVKEDVQAIHYFANTSQLFLADLMARGGKLRPQDSIMLTIEYEHPETGAKMVEEYAFPLGEIEQESTNVSKGRLVMRFIDGLAWMAARPVPSRHGSRMGAWQDDDGWRECDAGRQDLDRLSQGIADDPEVRRVLSLWEKYCARYERPRTPVQRDRDAPPDRWPSAGEDTRGR
jgi:Ca-activated chloride channel family protein